MPVVFTSAGNPKTWTGFLHEHGIKVAHVVSSSKFARKCEEAGVDAVVAEGFEAGGHNGREETTTMCLIPQVRGSVGLPLIAAGGIGSGATMLAAMALGAEGDEHRQSTKIIYMVVNGPYAQGTHVSDYH